MTFALKYRETDALGGFVAWSSKFYYEYTAETSTLRIFKSQDRSVELLSTRLTGEALRKPMSFIGMLHKTSKVKALMYSNNKTCNLANTVDSMKLPAILESGLQLSEYSLLLSGRNFRDFSRQFCDEFGLGKIHISAIEGRTINSEFFRARLKSIHGHHVDANASSLCNILQNLSEQVMQNLIMMEYGYSNHGSAHNLLRVSSYLAILGKVLDARFVPEHFAEIAQDTESQQIA